MTNFSDMLSKAKAMQEKMKEAQDQIKKIEVEGEAGGNLVKVVLSGDYELKSIKISDAAKKESQEIINDLMSLRNEYHPGNDVIKLKARLSPVHRELDLLINNAIKLAELQYLKDKPLIQQAIVNAQLAKNRMKEGDVQGASELQKKDAQIKELIQHGN